MAAPRRPSPLTLLLGAIFIFSANVLAAAAVLGIDLGTEYIKAALVKPGIPLEIVLTKDSRRKETSAVAFKPSLSGTNKTRFPERLYGADAMAVAARFPADVYPNLKTLLGLSTDDPVVVEYGARHPALQLQPHSTRSTAAFKAESLPPEEDAWLVEELLAMELQNIQKNAELAAGQGSSVRSVLLTVPPFYTTEEKRAIQTAAKLAGLKVLGLISDGLAVGLNYGSTRQFPNIKEGGKPEYHMVFDIGAGSTSASVLRFQSRTVKDVGKFNKTLQEVHLLGSGWDRALGGDSLNYLIMDDIVSCFIQSEGAKKISAVAKDVKSNGRAMAKIAKEAERIRHVLSANQNTQASFEGLYGDVDYKYKISRADFEALAESHADRVAGVVHNAIKMAGIQIENLSSVILHGGASRTPFIQRALEKAIGSSDVIRSNVNADEAAVFGAAFRAAELSPSFRVKEIRIAEGPMFPIGISWTNSKGKTQRQPLWTAVSPLGGPAKELTFGEKDDFTIHFFQQVGDQDRDVGSLKTMNLTATVAAIKEQYPSCAPSEVDFKLSLGLNSENGEVRVVKAAVECVAQVPEKEGFVGGVKNLFGFGKKDQQPLKSDSTSDDHESSATAGKPESGSSKDPERNAEASSASSATSSSSTETTTPTAATASKEEASKSSAEAKTVTKSQRVSIPVEIVLDKGGLPALSRDELAKALTRLKEFAASDKARIRREEVFNHLEGYTYKLRDMLEGDVFISRSTEQERSKLAEKSSEISSWLYEDGADATQSELEAKLKVLEDLVSPIQTRITEAEKRPELMTSLREVLNRTEDFVIGIRKQIAEYEAWQASASTATSSESSTSSAAAAPSSSGDFDGLEDDAPDEKVEAEASEKKKKEGGPVPPLVKKEDLDEVDKLCTETKKWMKEMESSQEKLALNADPVFLSKDILEKRKKVDMAGIDLAMKGFRMPAKKGKKGKKSAGKKPKASFSTEPLETIHVGKKGERFTMEDMDEMLDRVRKADADRNWDEAPVFDNTFGDSVKVNSGREKEPKAGSKDGEKNDQRGEKKPGHDEL